MCRGEPALREAGARQDPALQGGRRLVGHQQNRTNISKTAQLQLVAYLWSPHFFCTSLMMGKVKRKREM
jgi:hypothetical protein